MCEPRLSAEVQGHVEEVWLDSCRQFRRIAESLTDPEARAATLKLADELDDEAEQLLGRRP